jgi:enamine deaminase RidA (YjgF/YER057c/UK114 family)
MLSICRRQSGEVCEVFVTLGCGPSEDGAPKLRQVFSELGEVLSGAGARLLQERVFGPAEALRRAARARREAYGELADGVEPAWILTPAPRRGGLAGVQIHAIAGPGRIRPLSLDGRLCGRMHEGARGRYITASALKGRAGLSPAAQAGQMFEKAKALLGSLGAHFCSVVRTWVWLGRILDWYDPFNKVRRDFYSREGLLNCRPSRIYLPASTGVGLRPAGGQICALDFVAALDESRPRRVFRTSGRQGFPLDYGSAFSRAVRAYGPTGKVLFVSGTAAIDPRGRTVCVGKAKAQIAETLNNVRAVLHDGGCSESDIVQAIAYCKTREVEDVFRRDWGRLPWPCLILRGDVCRPELLFELEATACPGASVARAS